MAAVLGISAFYHDGAAVLVVDGKIVAGAQEERFTRIKHDPSFPVNAIEYCLNAGDLQAQDLELVAFYEKPLVKMDRLLETYLAVAPRGFVSFYRAVGEMLGGKLDVSKMVRRHLPQYKRKVVFSDHHQSHLASAFYPSPFGEAAVLALDGVGEWTTTSWGVGRGKDIQVQGRMQFPHSLGLLYSAFTYYCGFRVNSGEYKLMGLAPYGQPIYVDQILKHLIDLRDDGSFRLDQSYFNYCSGLTMTGNKFHRLFGKGPRDPESPIETHVAFRVRNSPSPRRLAARGLATAIGSPDSCSADTRRRHQYALRRHSRPCDDAIQPGDMSDSTRTTFSMPRRGPWTDLPIQADRPFRA
jgi:carbamoyltransferase